MHCVPHTESSAIRYFCYRFLIMSSKIHIHIKSGSRLYEATKPDFFTQLFKTKESSMYKVINLFLVHVATEQFVVEEHDPL